VTDETGNNDVRDQSIVNTADLRLTIVPDVIVGGTMSHMPQVCLRDNECSQQQLVRLVGYRGPAVSTAASWDRLRREQAALLAG
jgi:hypothetical protein